MISVDKRNAHDGSIQPIFVLVILYTLFTGLNKGSVQGCKRYCSFGGCFCLLIRCGFAGRQQNEPHLLPFLDLLQNCGEIIHKLSPAWLFSG